ncbi:6-phosphofructokinase [Tyzzerella sp. OttesenSCG-928-J15]|nr:6-phosphofructokinase [Tyzzerella sp. OttesenSCG-928-J15]
MKKGNAVIAQSGGMTAAINATLAGVYEIAATSGDIDKVYGALHGIEGIIKHNLVELNLSEDDIIKLKITPGGYLGTCRYKLPGIEKGRQAYEDIFETFNKYNIRYFFYIGGNDSMDTANKIAAFAREIEYDLTVVGLPKTIDNDLPVTDHTPGFGSAAKYICATCAEIYLDVKSFDIPYVTIIEIMGRNAGWLTAASALVKENYDSPDLIYVPEVVFDLDKFYADIEDVMKRKKTVIAVISEGIKTADGKYFCEQTGNLSQDNFGHKALGGSSAMLAGLVKEKYGCKTRSIELSLLQRCAGHLVSATDINESFEIGKEGARTALAGTSDVMMVFERNQGPNYSVSISHCPLSSVANEERKIPREWINKEGNYLTKECNDYIRPLINGEIYPIMNDGIPHYLECDKVGK